MPDAQLAVLGAGNMGLAILRGIVAHELIPAASIIVYDPDERRTAACQELGCTVAAAPRACVEQAGQLLLAVKPQVFDDAAAQIAPLPHSMVVISIMAGLSSTRIRGALGQHARVVRAMPNTPAQVGKAMTAIALGEAAAPGDEALAASIFKSLGKVVTVEEEQMYAVTAVSGSGPAYVFLLAESIQQAAEQMGLSHYNARTLAEQTLIGAAALLEQSELTATQLREAVTSPGGTTAAALEEMFEHELPEIIIEAIMAARDRGIELDR